MLHNTRTHRNDERLIEILLSLTFGKDWKRMRGTEIECVSMAIGEMRLDVLCLWCKHETLYYADRTSAQAQQLSRAYWTIWIVEQCALISIHVIYAYVTLLFFIRFMRLSLCMCVCRACIDSLIHNKVQIILWDLCLSIALLFIVRALCHCCCRCCCCCCSIFFLNFLFHFFASIQSLPFYNPLYGG